MRKTRQNEVPDTSTDGIKRCGKLHHGPKDSHILIPKPVNVAPCCKRGFAKTILFTNLEKGILTWTILKGPKCNHKGASKREASRSKQVGDEITRARRRHGVSRGRQAASRDLP